MNRKTLQKLADAIERGDKAYAMGMLDMIMDTLPEETEKKVMDNALRHLVGYPPKEEVSDEAKALDYMAKAKMESIKLLSDESAH